MLSCLSSLMTQWVWQNPDPHGPWSPGAPWVQHSLPDPRSTPGSVFEYEKLTTTDGKALSQNSVGLHCDSSPTRARQHVTQCRSRTGVSNTGLSGFRAQRLGRLAPQPGAAAPSFPAMGLSQQAAFSAPVSGLDRCSWAWNMLPAECVETYRALVCSLSGVVLPA